MKPIGNIHALLFVLLGLLITSGAGAASQGMTLSSPEELDSQYARWQKTKSQNDIQFFMGRRKDLDPKYKVGKSLFRFNPATLEVVPLLTEEELKEVLSEAKSVGGLATDKQGRRVAISALGSRSDGGIVGDIIVVDSIRGSVLLRMSDGQRNYSPSFSPDGRYLAYYKSDPHMNSNLGQILQHSAGCVIDLSTGKAKTFTKRFMDGTSWVFPPPQWLDSERVAFLTFCEDKALIEKQIGSFAGDKCPGLALAYPSSGKVKWLLIRPFPNRPKNPPHLLIDSIRGRIILSDRESVILSTDYDLENRAVIHEEEEADGSKIINVYGVREDGTVHYRVLERAQEVIPARLFE